jgi:hypothetical protein
MDSTRIPSTRPLGDDDGIETLLTQILPDPSNPIIGEPIGAANEIISECASYENDGLKESSEPYTSIKYTSTTDNYGRTIYRFEDKNTTPLVLVIFENAYKKLISVNGNVIPLKTFLTIEQMEYVKHETLSLLEEANQDLRRAPTVNEGYVRAQTNSNHEMGFSSSSHNFMDTTVPLLMNAISVLAKQYIVV